MTQQLHFPGVLEKPDLNWRRTEEGGENCSYTGEGRLSRMTLRLNL